MVVVKKTMEDIDNLNSIPDQLHLYMESVFATGNGVFQQDNASCHKIQILLEWFQEHNVVEFQEISWSLPNSPILKPLKHICSFLGYGPETDGPIT